MRAIRGQNMLPELAVRRLVHKLGYRFRLHRTDLPGKPDLVFPSRRKVIFVHYPRNFPETCIAKSQKG